MDLLLVDTDCGPVSGTLSGEVVEWRGIPYASPPVGELRWKPPEPPACWPGVLDGSTYGHQCVQQSPWSSVTAGQEQEVVGEENCLYLNVFAPAGWRARKNMPVVVWIHGGSLVSLNSSFEGYRVAPSVVAEEEVIVVSMNYRLHALVSLSTFG